MTTFATGLGFPVGMAELADGSILVAESRNSSFFGSTRGTLARLIDNNNDGVSDQRTVLVDNVDGGGLTSLRVVDDLVFTTGQSKPISIYRLGSNLDDPLTLIGKIRFTYPSPWLHPHSGLLARSMGAGAYELYLQVGSDRNFDETTRTVPISTDFGLSANLAGDALHRVDLTIANGAITSASAHQVATGLRNPAGMAFDARTGDFVFADNGIDGVVDANEPTSADELNRISQQDLASGQIIDFGFPTQYIEYRTGIAVGGSAGEGDPLVAFQPIPDPQTGSEAEGPNEIAFLPDSFTLPLHGGLVVGMHGRFNAGGTANEENPLVFVNMKDRTYQHLIGNDETEIGHLDGFLATEDSLYMADISPQGNFGNGQANSGVIYRMQSRYPSIDRLSAAVREGNSDAIYDVNADGQVNAADRDTLIKQINRTYFGDANFDGRFDSGDLVDVFAQGQYEDGVVGNSSWAAGDWDGDGDFSTSDLITAFQDGGYADAQGGGIAVPEPASMAWAAVAALAAVGRRRRQVPVRK
jgi:uncharacterized protein (TIGR03382 family)